MAFVAHDRFVRQGKAGINPLLPKANGNTLGKLGSECGRKLLRAVRHSGLTNPEQSLRALQRSEKIDIFRNIIRINVLPQRDALTDQIASKRCFTGTIRSCNQSDRKSTRLNSSHVRISYAVFCLKQKN